MVYVLLFFKNNFIEVKKKIYIYITLYFFNSLKSFIG